VYFVSFSLFVCYEIVCFNGHTWELSLLFRLLRICPVASSTHSYRTLSLFAQSSTNLRPQVMGVDVVLMLFQCSVVQVPVQTHFLAEPVYELVHPVCRSQRASF